MEIDGTQFVVLGIIFFLLLSFQSDSLHRTLSFLITTFELPTLAAV